MNENSSIQSVAIISPGDMGHAIGKALAEDGLKVITCLKNRSQRTHDLAAAAGIANRESLEQVTLEADLILSIIVPDQALEAARQIADAARRSGSCPLVADCNAISPEMVRQVAAVFADFGGHFIDASIIGFPPRAGQITRIYASGPRAHDLQKLTNRMIQVLALGDQIGQASAVKMCYAALTKGTFALQFAMLLAAQQLDVFDELCAELDFSQTDSYRLMQQQLPRLPAKAHRWVGEMNEIAKTFDQVDVSPMFHQAAAEIYRSISRSLLGKETPENIDVNRTLAETIEKISSTRSLD